MTEGLVTGRLQLPACRRLVPELALQGQHLVAELPDVQPEVILRGLGLGLGVLGLGTQTQ